MRLRGFKTFARPTELAFEPGVTVIIGPNGSGKSNIADAVLWVLGEQSPANLRGRSMQDVIFSGPDGRKSSAVAEVSLVFDNECGSFPLDCTQVEITRRLVRDSGSEYRVNGSGCRLLDVQDLVGGLGLGREMHSVISQGKVEALLNSTPEARRALLEEAAGLGVFKKRRERAQAKLERTRQNLLRVSDVEREVNGALRPLRQQVVAAERFAEATEEWAGVKTKWLLVNLAALQDSGRETKDELARLRSRRAEIETGLTELRRQRLAEEEQFAAVLQGREELSALYHRVQSETERVEGRAVALRQRMARLEGDLDRARRRLELAQGESAALASRREEMMAASTDETRLGVVDGWGEAIKAALEESLPAYRALSETEDDLKDTVFELEAGRSRGVQDREFLRREIEGKERAISELTGVMQAATARLEELEARTAVLERQRTIGDEALRRAREALAAAVSEREDARAREAEAGLTETALLQSVAGLESREAVLRDVLERREGIPAGARALLASAEGCRLLTEVLTVEPGYERAVSAALGSLAQAVVWGDPSELSLALQVDGPFEAIRESGPLGRAAGSKPIGAATPPEWDGAQADTLPAGTRDLWEVVSGPDDVVGTLKLLVPRTAVLTGDERPGASVTDAAGGSWRVVTRSGELARSGLHVARRQDVGAETILRAQNELHELAQERAGLAEKSAEARATAEEARDLAAQAEGASRRAEETLREAESALAAHANECDLHARRVEESGVGRAELQARHERELASLAQLHADLRLLEEAMAAREGELEVARVALRSAQTRLEVLRNSVGRLRAKKSQAELVAVRLRERCRANRNERERAQALWESATVEAARYGRRVTFLERYLPVLTGLLTVVERLAERLRTLSSGLETRAEEARSRSQEAAKTIRDRGGAETELQHEHDGLTDRIALLQVDEARFDDRRSALEDELAELRRRHLSPRGLTTANVVGEDAGALLGAVERAERRREKIGPVNPLAEQECAELEERARFLKEQRRDLEASVSQLQELISDLDEHIEGSFSEIFQATKEHFSSVIATVFPGAKGALKLTEGKTSTGQAENRTEGLPTGLEDQETLTDAAGAETVGGIALEVRLPNKAPRSMSLLSGGEKAMTAIAFLFSLFLARPCPFYILDEVEASLDDVNIRRFLSLIRRYRERTQFIIITHQRQTMEIADTLYGVALEADGTSRVLSRRFGGQKEARDHAGRRETVTQIPKGA
jgi:chromosome segregation protein